MLVQCGVALQVPGGFVHLLAWRSSKRRCCCCRNSAFFCSSDRSPDCATALTATAGTLAPLVCAVAGAALTGLAKLLAAGEGCAGTAPLAGGATIGGAATDPAAAPLVTPAIIGFIALMSTITLDATPGMAPATCWLTGGLGGRARRLAAWASATFFKRTDSVVGSSYSARVRACLKSVSSNPTAICGSFDSHSAVALGFRALRSWMTFFCICCRAAIDTDLCQSSGAAMVMT